MSYFTEGVVNEVTGLGQKVSAPSLRLDPVPDFSIKHGGKTYVVWVEQSTTPTPSLIAAEVLQDYDMGGTVTDALFATLKNKRVRLHSVVPRSTPPSTSIIITSIDLI